MQNDDGDEDEDEEGQEEEGEEAKNISAPIERMTIHFYDERHN